MRFIFGMTFVLLAMTSNAGAQNPAMRLAPNVHDPRLVVELVAAEPDIVHPIACDCDARGRLLVIESHTHFAPKDYAGPKFDRIRMIDLSKETIHAERITTFFEGTRHTMGLAVHRDGSVYVATRNEILRLRDTKATGVANEKTRLVFLDTQGDYPHNGLSGLCFDAHGDLIFGIGENLGAAYKLIGADGAKVTGEGDGGQIFHCSANGTKLRRVATGFWNPFGICRDPYGRVFCVDNDPDQSPPCRMVHVVEGGDYGFQFRYGRSGKHPFQSWHGQLPGTLPMMTDVGEAPCQVISYESDGLPAEYCGKLLVTSWADHRVERYAVKPHGASFKAERLPFVQGSKDFRPVGLATAPDGSLFVTDWVLSNYELHGKGGIWHIRWKDAPKAERPPKARAAILKDMPVQVRVDATKPIDSKTSPSLLLELMADNDPFIRHAAIQRMARPENAVGTLAIKPSQVSTQQRPGLLLAHRKILADPRRAAMFATVYLNDANEDVRFLAAKWVADEKLDGCRQEMENAMRDPKLGVRIYLAYATALARLDGQEVSEARLADYFAKRLEDDTASPTLRVQLLRQVPATHPKLTIALLARLLKSDDESLKFEAVRALVEHPSSQRYEPLLGIFRDVRLGTALRGHATLGLADRAEQWATELAELAANKDSALRHDAIRALIGVTLNDPAILHTPEKDRPPANDLDAWTKLLEGPADPEAGARVFFHPKLAGCFRCHSVNGRGQDVGPDLSTIGRIERRPLLESILQPSNTVAPNYQVWALTTTDGKIRTGMLLNTFLDEYTYLDAQGNRFKVTTTDIESQRALPTSIMPDGLLDRLTFQEVRDLLAFLQRLK